ncbi:MAG: hypothetical protein WDZ82_02575 [Candidatus Paceibacterota bacterium]
MHIRNNTKSQKERGFFPANAKQSKARFRSVRTCLPAGGRRLRKSTSSTGFTLIETVFYILLLVVLFSIIVQTLLTITGTFQKVEETTTINRSAIFGIERIMRETRNANEILEGQSIFNASSSVLVLGSSNDSGASVARKFSLENEQIRMAINGVDQGSLTPDDVKVTQLLFHHIQNSTSSEAVRMEVTMVPTNNSTSSAVTFYNTAVVRGTYSN